MDHFKKDLMYFGVFMLLLFIGWIITGGPEKARESGSDNDKFQHAIAPIDSGTTYDASISSLSPIKLHFQSNTTTSGSATGSTY